MQCASLGSINTGTLRTEDLIDAFAYELESHVQNNADKWCSDAGRSERDRMMALIGEARETEDFESDEASEILEELTDALNTFAPDYAYFGSHPGDGADFGFWLYEDFQSMARDDGALEVSDTSEVPEDYSGSVLHVNDHGNATLYHASNGQLSEVWSCV